MKILMYQYTHVGPCLLRPPNSLESYEPIIVSRGEHLIESYTLVKPEPEADLGPEYEMYRDSPPPWIVS